MLSEKLLDRLDLLAWILVGTGISIWVEKHGIIFFVPIAAGLLYILLEDILRGLLTKK